MSVLVSILKWLAIVVGSLIGAVLALAVWNGSFWSSYSAPTTLLAHRGMAQTFHREELENDTCTATRIFPPEHPCLENTIASMRAAFDAGADIVEFDIHPTTDGQFAVFHDWTIDCRTEGKGVGLMPTMEEVLAAFPQRRFLINIKSNDPAEGDLLAERLLQLPQARRDQLMAYGGAAPIARLKERIPKFRAMSRATLLSCGTNYIAFGWSGAIPPACHDTIVLLPSNTTFLFWGWPNLFLERMANAGTLVFVTGPISRQKRRYDTSGVDDLAAAQGFPPNFPGGIWTNRIDRIASHFRAKPNSPPPD